MRLIQKQLLAVVLLILFQETTAQGIRGTVVSEKGDPLAFASVYVRNISNGIPTNPDGYFEMKLDPGHYDILVQHLGYQAVQQTVEVQEGWKDLNVTLELQTYALQEVEVKSRQEDPALTIMRRAISKAKYHRLQVQEYSMMVYIKGTGQLTDAPFFLKKKLKEEGINLNEAFTSESVSKITFKQPNQVDEKVISIRSSGEQNQTSPAPYIGASFYDEKINEAISPLSRSAFAYYRFRYEGSFFENDLLVNKIRVTPRSRGERVFEGFIYIIDGIWAIHSLDLKTSLMGFDIGVKQQYASVEENVWMPLTHTYSFGGKFFGFAGEYLYLASTRDYSIQLNPDLVAETEILDEKVEEIPEDVKQFDPNAPALEQLAEEGQMTRKDFRKMINEYEKEAIKIRENAEVISSRTYSIDSMANKRSVTYWDSIRPVRLTDQEIKGYKRDDSLALVEAAKDSDVDSIAQKAKRRFNPLDLLNGGGYNFGRGRSAGFHTNWTKISFNTIEGFKIGFSGYYQSEKTSKMSDSLTREVRTWNVRPAFRYGFTSKQAYATLEVKKSVKRGRSGHGFGAGGGKFIMQYNRDNPINEQVNAFYSLFLKQNHMKLYEQLFGRIFWEQQLGDDFNYLVDLEYADRQQLINHTDFSFYRKPEREYTSNQPENYEAPEKAFDDHQALILEAAFEWRPGLKYSLRNGRKSPLWETAPLITGSYRKGIPAGYLGQHAANFDHVEVGISHAIPFGVSGKLDFNISAGSFLNQNQVYFMDYKHFGGNGTIFSNMGAASNYRFMDYYRFSTRGGYFSSILHYQFRKFLLTQLPMLRMSGVRENIFFNYLKTQYSPHYTEIGYSLDNLFRIFRVEMGAGFENGQYSRGGLRFGVATFINISVGE
jgi:hypothetical protein